MEREKARLAQLAAGLDPQGGGGGGGGPPNEGPAARAEPSSAGGGGAEPEPAAADGPPQPGGGGGGGVVRAGTNRLLSLDSSAELLSGTGPGPADLAPPPQAATALHFAAMKAIHLQACLEARARAHAHARARAHTHTQR